MAKQTNFYYVLVLAMNGPKFVTKTEGYKYCYWNENDAPLPLSKGMAQDIANGLTLNGTTAFMVQSNWEVDKQPFLYDKGRFEWHNYPVPLPDFE